MLCVVEKGDLVVGIILVSTARSVGRLAGRGELYSEREFAVPVASVGSGFELDIGGEQCVLFCSSIIEQYVSVEYEYGVGGEWVL